MTRHSAVARLDIVNGVGERMICNMSATPRDLPLEKTVEEFLVSKMEERLRKVHKKPEWDVARVSPSCKVVLARRELDAADSRLAEKRKEQSKQRALLDKQWEDLAEKEKALRDSFTRFHSFLTENELKRERASKKLQEELLLQEHRDLDIAAMKETISKLELIKQNMDQHVTDYKIYEDFLKKVVTVSKFNSIHEVLNRYETLVATRDELAARQKRDLTALESERSEMAHLSQEKTHTIIGLNNELAALHVRYDKALANTSTWEASVERIKKTGSKRTSELGQVQAATWSMYQQVCKHRGEPPTLGQGDVHRQLMCIKRFLQEMTQVVQEAKSQANTDKTTVRAK
ncbi:unnamed protein product [Timema podura]|uniref:DUF4200 domain-containing protein n=1 Tax=Timema podura TaxID=61482 RepID=A0ABN7NYD9_TIMPD|nr:unnamed protein product [Timema podura]